MSKSDLHTARRRVKYLVNTLRTAVERDPEQEIQGIALPVLDAVIDQVKGTLAHDPVIKAVERIISPQAIERGEAIRAIDALLVAEQLDAAIPYEPVTRRIPPRIVR